MAQQGAGNQQPLQQQQPQPVTADDMVNAISAAEARKRATDLPCYYGESKNDKIPCSAFLRRVRQAAIVARWTGPETAMQFALSLRGAAARFYEVTAEEHDEDWTQNLDNWEPLFLTRFEPDATGPQIVRVTKTLRQASDEAVDDFRDRVVLATQKWARRIVTPDACRATPAIINACRLTSKATMDVMALAFFMTGLGKDYREKVTDSNPQTLEAALLTARNLELSKLGSSKDPTTASACAAREEEEEEAETDGEEEQVDAVKRKGKKKSKKAHAVRSGGSGGSGGQRRSTITCWYCRKSGHRQDACHKRKRDKAPMVDRFGNPYRVNEVGQAEGRAEQGASAIQAQFPLNW